MNNISKDGLDIPADALGNYGGVINAPTVPNVNFNSPQQQASVGPKRAMSFNDVFRQSLNNAPSAKVESVPLSSLSLGSRYKSTVPYEDAEEMYAQQQGVGSKWLNAGLKTAGTFTSSFIGGTAGFVWGVGELILTQRLAALADNAVNRKVDDITTGFEDLLPNYYTQRETTSDAISTDNLLSANFWANKGLQNLGFAAGALVGGGVWNKVFKSIAGLNKAVLAGHGMETATAIEKAMSIAPNASKYTAFDGALTSTIRKYGINPIAQVLKQSERLTISTLGSFGEGSIESVQKMKQFKTKLTDEFVLKYGREPQGEELKEINDYTDSVGKYVLAGNLMLLSATNYLQLPKIMGSSRRFDKALINQIEQKEIGGAFSSVIDGGVKKFGKRAVNAAGLLFSPSEAFEEAGQYAIQEGVASYFDKAYKNQKDTKEVLSNVYGSMNSVLGEGWDKVFTDKNGIESLLLGGFSGGMQQSGIVGTYKNKEGKTRLGIGRSGEIGERGFFGEGGERAANTEMALKALNSSNVKEQLQAQAKYLGIAIGSQQERQQAIIDNNKLQEKDSEHDYIMSYVMPRVLYGKEESVYQELDGYAAQAATTEGFDELVSFGIVSPNEKQPAFIERINNLKNLTKSVADTYENIKDKYSDIANKDGERIYNDDVIEKMVYATAKINNYDQRIPNVNQNLTINGIPTFDLLGKIMDGEVTPKIAYKEGVDTIDALDIAPDEKDNLKLDLHNLIDMSLRRRRYVNEYGDIKKNPQNWKAKDKTASEKAKISEPQQQSVVPPAAAQTQATPTATPSTTAEGEQVINQELVIEKPSYYVNSKDEYEPLQTNREYINNDLYASDPLHKFKVLGFNPDGTVNVELIDGSFATYDPEVFTGAERVSDSRDAIINNAQEIKEIQEELEEKSDFSTGFEVDEYNDSKEGALPSADKLFFRTKTASSKDPRYTNGLPINVTNYNEFVNNVDSFPNRKNIRFTYVTPNRQNALGLSRLAEFSYMKEDGFVTTDVWLESISKIDDGVVMAVFTEFDNGKLFLIDKDGKRIKNQDGSDAVLGNPNNNFNIKQTIFSTTPTINEKARSSDDSVVVEQYRTLWKDQRKTLFTIQYQAGDPIDSYEFGLSKGFAVKEKGKVQHNAISKVFNKIKQSVISDVQGLIEVSTLGYITHKDGIAYKFAVGRPVLKYGDKLEYLQNDKITANQAITVVKVLEKLHNVLVDSSIPKNQKIKENTKLLTYIKSVLFWSSKRVTNNSFFINYATGEINIAGQNFDFSNIQGQEKEIIDKLSNVYTNTSNELLTKYFNEPFYEQFWNGKELQERKWKGYQAYLLSDLMPDNKTKRNTAPPLTVNITVPTDAVPYAYEQKYAFPTNLKLADPQVTKYDLTGKTPITMNVFGIDFKFTYGPEGVKFTDDVAMQTAVEKRINAAMAGDPELAKRNPEELLTEMLGAVVEEIKKEIGVINPVNTAPDKYSTKGTPNTIELQGIKFTFTHDGNTATIDQSPEFLNGALAEGTLRLLEKPEFANVDPEVLRATLLRAATDLANNIVANQIANDVKTATTPTLDPRVADIERRRQEDLERVKNNNLKEGDQADWLSGNKQAIDELNFKINFNKQQLANGINTGGEFDIRISQSQADVYNKEIKEHESKIKDILDVWKKIKEDRTNEVNAKYNAELAALQGGQQAAPQAPKIGELYDLNEELNNYQLTDDFKFITPLLKENNVQVSYDAAHRGGELPKVASIDSEVVDGKYQMILTINKAAFDKKTKAEQKYVIAHEFVHGLIKVKLNEKGDIEGTELYKGLTDIFTSVEEYYHKAVSGVDKETAKIVKDNFSKPQITHLRQMLDYIGGSVEEMATIGLTDPTMIKFLKLMPGTAPAYTKKSLFAQLADMISKFLGLSNSKFNDLLTFMSDQLEQASAAPTDGLGISIAQGLLNQQITPKQRKRKRDGYPVYPELSAEQKYYLVEDFKAAFYLLTFPDTESLFKINKDSANASFKNIVDMYKNKGAQYTDEQYMEIIEATKRQLGSLYISFDSDEVKSINDEDASDKLYAPEAFSINLKKSTPYAVKILNSSLIRTDGKQSEDSLKLPNAKINTKHDTIELIPESEVYSVLANRLVNIKSIDDFVNKLCNIAKSNADYVQLFVKLGGNMITGKIDFENFENADFRLFISAMQTYTKSKPEMFIQYLKEDSTFRGAADLTNGAKQVEKRWINNIIIASKNKDSIISYNRDSKQYEVANDDIPEDSIEFLNKIGITFTPSIYNKLNNLQKKEFEKAVIKIKADITSGKKKGVVSLKRGKFKTLGNGISRLADLFTAVEMPNQNNSIYNAEGKRINSLTESNAPSLFEYQFNSIMNLSEIKDKMPHLLDIFSQSSDILRPGGLFFNENDERIVDEDGNIRELKVQVISGELDTDEGAGSGVSKMNEADSYITQINQNINGSYYILVPADSVTEWMMNLGNRISYKQFAEGRGYTDAIEILNKHLDADIELALDAENREKLENVKGKGTELRFFKDILPQTLNDELTSLIQKRVKGETEETEFRTELNKFKTDNSEAIAKSITDYLNQSTTDVVDKLKSLKLINLKPSKNDEVRYQFKKLDAGFQEDIKKIGNVDVNDMSEEDITTIAQFLSTNYILNNIELHKILFGDPYQFAIKNKDGKTILEETKRIKMFLSPRKFAIDFPALNNWLNEYNNEIEIGEDEYIDLDENDFGYYESKSYINTVVIKEVIIDAKLYPGVDTKEADGFSFTDPGFHREAKTKNGQWSDEANDFHNWQMAYARQKLSVRKINGELVYKGYETKPALKKYDEKLIATPRPNFVIDVTKPIVTGDKFGKTDINLIGHKMAQMPLYYEAVEGTALEDVFIKMFKEKADYIVMQSGAKFGIEEMHELYKDGKINDEPFNNQIQIPFTAYGIQVETGYKDKKGQTLGSQPTKIVTIDLFSGGEAIGDTPERQQFIKDAVERHDNALKALYKEGADSLLNELGITFEDGEYVLDNNKKVAEVLRKQLIDDGASANLIASLDINPETGNFETPLEASPNYMQIVRLLYSMINKKILSPRVNGMSAVQVPVTGWEDLSKGRRVVEINGKQVLTDDTLKFYEEGEDENGNSLRYCEIYTTLPSQARALFSDKKKFPNDEAIVEYLNKQSPEALMGIGFRIPNQAVNSNERFKIKGILPDFMGNTVVVPSAITTKAGSDFDIDKLNMYIKSLFKDALGNIRVVELKGSEEETKAFYGNIFDQLSEKEQRYISKQMQEADNEDVELQQKLIGKQEKLNDKIANKEMYVNKTYRQALENEYYSAIDVLLDLPENFKRLTTPNTTDTLKGIANKIDELTGYDESKIKNRILDRQYMSFLRYAFQKGKSWIGISATATTGLSLRQKAGSFVDHVFKMSLPHNKTADGKVDLSQRFFVGTKKFISDILSEFTSAFADAGTDPFIFKLIYSDQIVGSTMFLAGAGADIEQSIYFLNQPIVKDFVTTADADNKIILSEITKEDSTLIKSIKDKYATSEAAFERTTEINVNNLNKNIGVEKLTDDQKAEQLLILEEFFSIAKAANGLFIVTEATNYDTFKATNADEFRRKLMKTSNQYKFTKDSFRISSAKDILDKTHLRTLVDALTKVNLGFGTILRFNTAPYRAALNKVIDTYAVNNFISPTKFSNIANKLSASLLDYIIQTNGNFDAEKLVYGEDSVINKFQSAVETYPDIKILQDLEIIPGKTIVAPSTIALKVSPETAADVDRYTEGFRELRDNPKTNDLYNDLLKLSILQGTYRTAVSFKETMPQEDISAEITKAVNTPGVENNLKDFYENARFQRANFNDANVAPRISPPMMGVPEANIYLPFGDIIEAYAFTSAITFNGVDKESSRDLIGLHLDSKGGAYDFVTVTKGTYTKEGELVDFESGYTVQPVNLAIQLQKDENEYNKVYGYQKVKYRNGMPVKIKMSKTSPEQYVFKLVNLYGDGRYLTQYQTTLQKSGLSNGTIKVNKEYSDEAIIKALDKQGKLVGYSETYVVSEGQSSITVVDRYTDADVKANPNTIYVFGDNTKRTGTGGQAQIRNNPNAMGIATKLAPSMEESAFMTDLDLASNKSVIDSDIAKIKATGKSIVLPKDGFGTGLAKLKEKAPQTFTYLNQRLLQEFGFNNEGGAPSQPAPAVAETKPANIEVINKLEMAKNKLEAFEVSTDGILYNYFRGGARLKASSFDELVDRNLRSASTNGAYISKDGMPYDNLATSAFEASGMPMDNEYAVEALREFLTNYPDNWKTPYNNIINEIDSLEEQLGGREMTVKVDKKDITIKPTGEMFFADGKPVTDTVLQNQASIVKEKRNQTLRTSISGGFNFFILSDNKILLSGKNNVGKEYIADPEMMQRILDKAVIYKIKC
jgi:hypothetical protein